MSLKVNVGFENVRGSGEDAGFLVFAHAALEEVGFALQRAKRV
jgi:hypothetical protein